MFEKKHQKIISRRRFRRRLLIAVLIDFIFLSFSLSIGVLGYHFIGGLSFVDAFLNASMILGGMGPVDVLTNDSAKIFSGLYALYSGIAFLTSFAILIAPIFHRFLHKFHLEDEQS
ncbi:MAG: hypothetical protein ACP5P3_08050 [Ignavibacteria bacterium]